MKMQSAPIATALIALGLFSFGTVHRLGSSPANGSGTTVTQVTPILETQTYCAAATSCAVTLALAPLVGDTVRCDVYDANGSGTRGAPSGFTAIGTGPTTTGLKLQSYQRVVQSGDSTTYTATETVAQNMLVNCSWFHSGASPTFFTTIAIASGASVTTLNPPALTPNLPGILPVEVVGQTASSITATDPSFPVTIWTKNAAGISAAALTTSTVWPNLSAVDGAPSFSGSATASVVEVLIAQPALTPFTVVVAPGPAATAPPTGSLTASPSSVSVVAGSPGTSTVSGGTPAYTITTAPLAAVATATISSGVVTVTGVATGTTSLVVTDSASHTVTIPITVTPAGVAPPQRDIGQWFNQYGVISNALTTAAQLPQFTDWLIGIGTNTPGVRITSGTKSFPYTSFNMSEINSTPTPTAHFTGGSSVFPFHISMSSQTGRTCPAGVTGSGAFFAQQSATFNGNPTPDWTNTDGSKNWFVQVPGGTLGSAAAIGVGSYGGSVGGTGVKTELEFYMNPGSTTYQAFTQAVFNSCIDSYGDTDDLFTGPFEDNMWVGKQSLAYDIWDGYPQQKNFGGGTTGPFYSDNCNGGYSAIFSMASPPCTISVKLSTSDTPQNYPSDSSSKTASLAMFNALNHCGTPSGGVCPNNGGPFTAMYNGWFNTDQILNASTHILGATLEEFDVGFCGYNDTAFWPTATSDATSCIDKNATGYVADYHWRTFVENAASMYRETIAPAINPGVRGVVLSDQPTAGTYAVGSGNSIHDQLWHYAIVLFNTPDDVPQMMVSWKNWCGGGKAGTVSSSTQGAFVNCTDTWSLDAVSASGRFTPYPADATGTAGAKPCGEKRTSADTTNYSGTGTPCAVGGPFDPAIQATCPGSSAAGTCIFRVEWQHFWVYESSAQGNAACPVAVYDRRQWANCTEDIGPAALIVNASGSTWSTSTANLSAALPNTWNSIQNGYVLLPCTNGSSSLFGTTNLYNVDATVRCAAGTATDISDGGWFDFSPIANAESKTMLDTDVLFLVSVHP